MGEAGEAELLLDVDVNGLRSRLTAAGAILGRVWG